MPNDTKDRRDLTPEELAAKEERFRSFFSTTAVNLPEEMTRRDSDLPDGKRPRKKRKRNRWRCLRAKCCWEQMLSRKKRRIWSWC